jgi:hypothetical protein
MTPGPERHFEIFSPLLSAADIQQIKLLVADRQDIKQPVWEISTDEGRRDRARVSTGPWFKPGDESDYFYVEKRGRKWKIIPPVRHDRLKAEHIITIS